MMRKHAIAVAALLMMAAGAQSQDLKTQVGGMTQENQDRIVNILKGHGLLADGKNLQSLAENAQPLANPWCVAICNSAAALAASECGADATCLTLVEIARQACVAECN